MEWINNISAGIISGIISAILVWFFNTCIKINSRKNLKQNISTLKIYIDAIHNDLVWGSEDKKEEYYGYLISKIGIAIMHLEKTQLEIKKLDFIFNHRGIILHQISEIKKALDIIMNYAVGADSDNEIVERMKFISNKYFIGNDDILLRRADYILGLLKNLKKDDALDEACVADTEEEMLKIRKILSSTK